MQQIARAHDKFVEGISGLPFFKSKLPDEAKRIAQIIVHGGFLVLVLNQKGIEQFTNREDTTLPAREIYYVYELLAKNHAESFLLGHFLSTIEMFPHELYPESGNYIDRISFFPNGTLDHRVQSIELLTPEDIQDVKRRLRVIINKHQEAIETLLGKLYQ